jgi:hypothetical protein
MPLEHRVQPGDQRQARARGVRNRRNTSLKDSFRHLRSGLDTSSLETDQNLVRTLLTEKLS